MMSLPSPATTASPMPARSTSLPLVPQTMSPGGLLRPSADDVVSQPSGYLFGTGSGVYDGVAALPGVAMPEGVVRTAVAPPASAAPRAPRTTATTTRGGDARLTLRTSPYSLGQTIVSRHAVNRHADTSRCVKVQPRSRQPRKIAAARDRRCRSLRATA